jgi:hypothetical protein
MLYQAKQDASFPNLSSSAFTNQSTIRCIRTTDGVVKLTINKITKWSSTRPEKLIVLQVVKNFPNCTEPKDSLPVYRDAALFPIMNHIDPRHALPADFLKNKF